MDNGDNASADPAFEAFAAAARANGCADVLIRDWAANHETPVHAHPFDAEALVVAGEFWLTIGGETRHLRPGDRFAVPRGVDHAERYGPAGATFWVGRRGG
jgi:mannose-6-phosphate isomerase-like protein (cupin superfamily)